MTVSRRVAITLWIAASSLFGQSSDKVVYASRIGAVNDAMITVGSSSYGTDSAAAIQAAIAGGNIRLVVDGAYSLGTSLILSSNTTVECLDHSNGFIMRPNSNAEMFLNAHENAPNVPSGTGGFVLSNLQDTNIAIKNCMLNANAANAITDPGHIVNGAGQFVNTVRFQGLTNVQFLNNEIYDPPAYGFGAENIQNVTVADNYIHTPSPVSTTVGTIQIDGPAQWIYYRRNRMQTGDDGLALNADDGQEPGSGDSNAPRVADWNWKVGPISNAWVENNYCISCGSTGIRLLSTHERLDQIFITQLSGNVSDSGVAITTQGYPTGSGNVGLVQIDGLATVPTQVRYTDGPSNIWITANIERLMVSRLSYNNPSVNWPVLYGRAGAISELNLDDWMILNPSGTAIPCVVKTDGSITNLTAVAINWIDSGSSGSLFCGSAAPGRLTASGYDGANPVLADGYTPAVTSGDAFSGTSFSSGYLLDGLGAVPMTAYSLRRLSGGYVGPLIHVTSSASGNPGQDVGYTATGDLDTSSLLSFCGSNTCTVDTWYDQSGNAKNAVQGTLANEPVIVNNGTVVTSSGKVAMSLNGQYLQTNAISIRGAQLESFGVISYSADAAALHANVEQWMINGSDGDVEIQAYDGSVIQGFTEFSRGYARTTATYTPRVNFWFDAQFSAGSEKIEIDNSTAITGIVAGSFSSTYGYIGTSLSANQPTTYVSELVTLTSVLGSTQQAAAHSNQRAYWSLP